MLYYPYMAEEVLEIEESGAPYYGEEIAGWVVDEYHRHERGPMWYALAFVVGLSLVLYAVITQNFLFAVIIVMCGVIIGLSALREPQKVQFRLTRRGVMLGSQFSSYKDLRSFWILYEPPYVKNLYIDFKSPVMPHLVVPIEDQDPVKIRRTLLDYIREDMTQEQEPLSDLLSRVLKL